MTKKSILVVTKGQKKATKLFLSKKLKFCYFFLQKDKIVLSILDKVEMKRVTKNLFYDSRLTIELDYKDFLTK